MSQDKSTTHTKEGAKGAANQLDESPMVVDGKRPTVGDDVGKGVGGVGGTLAGAAIGSIAGPLGTVIGAVAGAVGGWWAGKAAAHAATGYTPEDDTYYNNHYTSTKNNRPYDQVRPLYQFGHLAGQNPDYKGRAFEDVEPDLQRGWNNDLSASHGEWQVVRPYAREGYTRARTLGEKMRDAVDDVKNGPGRGTH